jgi:signal transduction histidine kinase
MEVRIPDRIQSHSFDALRLSQAVGNILSNAIKFTPSGGVIKVEVREENATLYISITDDGPGISPQDQESIFTPFYRGAQGKRFVEGMGLGLSIARDTVRAHGGDVTVQSTLGEGSTFLISIPD